MTRTSQDILQSQQVPDMGLWRKDDEKLTQNDVEDSRDDFYGEAETSVGESAIFRDSSEADAESATKSATKSALFSALSLSPAWSQDSNDKKEQGGREELLALDQRFIHPLSLDGPGDGSLSRRTATCIYWEERIDCVSRATESTLDDSSSSTSSIDPDIFSCRA